MPEFLEKYFEGRCRFHDSFVETVLQTVSAHKNEIIQE